MKTLILTIVLAIGSFFASFAQNAVVDEVFDKYAMMEGITTVDISGAMIDLLKESDPELQDLGIEKVRILTVDDDALNPGLSFYDEIVPRLEMNDYNRLLDIQAEDSQVIILKKKAQRGPEELVLVTGGDDNTLIYIVGDINFAELGKIAGVLGNEDMSFQSMDF